MNCPSCGGVIGRDCFNPRECAMIEHQMESDQRQRQDQALEHIHHLERENQEMRQEINQLKAAVAALRNTT